MIDRTFQNLKNEPPRLLVSVRSAAEALAALSGGADVIDVKEPERGALGAADSTTIAEIVTAVDGRAPVTAALGELADLQAHLANSASAPLPSGVSLFKVGLANCGPLSDWLSQWDDSIAGIAGLTKEPQPQPVAVVYADWQSARAPQPNEVLSAAVEVRCPALLVDTWDKTAGGLFDHWPADDLRAFLDAVRLQGIATVLAGSLTGESFNNAVRLARIS